MAQLTKAELIAILQQGDPNARVYIALPVGAEVPVEHAELICDDEVVITPEM